MVGAEGDFTTTRAHASTDTTDGEEFSRRGSDFGLLSRGRDVRKPRVTRAVHRPASIRSSHEHFRKRSVNRFPSIPISVARMHACASLAACERVGGKRIKTELRNLGQGGGGEEEKNIPSRARGASPLLEIAAFPLLSSRLRKYVRSHPRGAYINAAEIATIPTEKR